MADHCGNAAGGCSFRFFPPEQVDQILREGAVRGREGSHAAIERILRHEPEVQRVDLWRRIRRLKNLLRGPAYRRSVWGPDDEKVLREGYESGWQGKRKAVRELLNRHPDWRPHIIWRRAAKLGLVGRISKRGQERSRLMWSESDDRLLLDLAGYKSARVISRMLHRSEAAVRYRLTVSGKSGRVHLEGFARYALATDLHLSGTTIQRLIVAGLLEVRDPRITRESLEKLCKSGLLVAREESTARRPNCLPDGPDCQRSFPALGDLSPGVSTARSVASGKPSRARRVWAEVANSLSVTPVTVEKFIARGVLKLYDPRITERSLRNFCRQYGSVIDAGFLSRETRDWLQGSMDFVPGAGESAARRFVPLRKHAQVVRRCRKCGRDIRGNAFFRHVSKCEVALSASA